MRDDQMTQRRLDTVLFDLDDTLHDDTLAYHSAAEAIALEVAAERSIDALALKQAYIAQVDGFWHRLTADQLTVHLMTERVKMWGAALQAVGLADDDGLAERCGRNYELHRYEFLQLFPGTLTLLRNLRRRGVKLGLVTNGFAETHHEKIARLRIGEFFDAIFIADEVGMLKPDPLLFAHACRRLERSPATSAMVGDRYDRDISGALRAGLYTVWLNLRGTTLAAGSRPPDATVERIEDVEAVLPLV